MTDMPRIWFITGSSRGLGRAITEAALAAGDCVIATARKPEQLTDLADKYGDRLLPLALDVTDNDNVQGAVDAGYRRFGRIDIVVNNAGYGDMAALEDVKIENFRAQIDTNFYGVVYVTKAVLPILRKQASGHIFQISSIGDRVGSVGLGAYQSAKWAVGGFSTVVAQEVAPFNVKITVLEPGGMLTDWAGSSMTIPPISEPYQQTVGKFAEWLRAYSGNEPSSPSKVAELVLTLADRADVPLRMLVGRDAVEYAGRAAAALAESDAKWRDLSLSTSP
jgi:NAD(P)-dependent dehydrogenase (short-subunit alcohol dehydrogenase family)